MSAATAFELCERLSDRLILGPVNLDFVPVLGKHYRNIQWSGEWIVEAVQSPEKPYAVEFMALAGKGRMDEAMKVYWRMQPLVDAIYDLQAPLLLHGSHPWAHMKYMQWCTGGNGGLLPLETRRIPACARPQSPRVDSGELHQSRHSTGRPSRRRIRGRQNELFEGYPRCGPYFPPGLRVSAPSSTAVRKTSAVQDHRVVR